MDDLIKDCDLKSNLPFLHIFIVIRSKDSHTRDKIIIRKFQFCENSASQKNYNHFHSSAVKRSPLISLSLEIVDSGRSQKIFLE